MQKSLRLTFRKGDCFAIAFVLILALLTAAAFIPRDIGSENAVVQVWQDGNLIRELPLNADETFEYSDEYTNLISVQNGKVSIIESDCPGADCVHSGWIRHSGRSIVCLPNRLEIRITGSADVDFVVG